jgi:hypothetical protein
MKSSAATPNKRVRRSLRLRPLFTQRDLAREIAAVLRVQTSQVEEILEMQRTILSERLCQYEKVEVGIGDVGLALSKGRKVQLVLNVRQDVLQKIALMLTQIEFSEEFLR